MADDGNYSGAINGHGTDMSGTNKPLVWFDVAIPLPDGGAETVRCRSYLAGGDEQKTDTAIRMARATLKLCGFDPDVRGLCELDETPDLLVGNVVPVRISHREYQGRLVQNADIALPRGVPKKVGDDLTARLRAAKSKDEPTTSPKAAAGTESRSPSHGALPGATPPRTPAAPSGGNPKYDWSAEESRGAVAPKGEAPPLDESDVPF